MSISVPLSGRVTASSITRAFAKSVGGCEVDLGSATFIEPAGIVAVATTVERAVREGREVVVHPPSSADCRNYLSRMQLGQYLNGLGVEHGLGAVRSRNVGDQLCELRRFRSEDELDDVAETIIRLYQHAGWNVVEPLYNCLYELALNAVQHSGEGGGCIALQAYPKSDDVAFAIGDSGVGLRYRLGSTTDQAAIGDAARKYVTSESEPGRGRGLAGVLELAGRNHGVMTMVSGTAHGEFKGGHWDPRVTEMSGPFLGTVAQVRFRRQMGD